MKLYFMKQKALDSLQKDISENLAHYQSKDTWIDQYFTQKDVPNYYFETGIDVSDYELVIGGPETDFQNAKILYEAYKGKINPVQASDLRLWAYLAHAKHWDYMFNRWKIDIPDVEDDEDEQGQRDKAPSEKVINRIKSRYFFGASRGKAFVRQGIARLYWSAYLTYDESDEDHYKYTEFFLSKQDIFTSITERSYARNKILVLSALKTLKEYPELSRDEIRLFLARLNQAGAITLLDSLDEGQAGELCSSIMNEIHQVPTLSEGSNFKAYNSSTGKLYGMPFKIIGGKASLLGKTIKTKPSNLIGRKEGSWIVISGKTYVIRDIQ